MTVLKIERFDTFLFFSIVRRDCVKLLYHIPIHMGILVIKSKSSTVLTSNLLGNPGEIVLGLNSLIRGFLLLNPTYI